MEGATQFLARCDEIADARRDIAPQYADADIGTGRRSRSDQ
jgi:hypothetical protein